MVYGKSYLTGPSFPKIIEWVCGKCHRIPEYGIDACSTDCLSSGTKGPNTITRLAVNFTFWSDGWFIDIADRWDELGTMELFVRHNAQHALLVIGKYEACEVERDVQFICPIQKPWRYPEAYAHLRGVEEFHIKWEDLECERYNFMLRRKETRAGEIQRILDCES